MAGAVFGEVAVALFVAGAVFGEVHMMLEYLVKLQCHFSWQAQHFLTR